MVRLKKGLIFTAIFIAMGGVLALGLIRLDGKVGNGKVIRVTWDKNGVPHREIN